MIEVLLVCGKDGAFKSCNASGHAGFAAKGKDIVCAAVTELLRTAVQVLQKTEGMCPLAKILFIADKIEPGRPQSTKEYRASLFNLSLNAMCLKVLEENEAYLRSKGKSIAPVTERFRESLKRDIAGDAQIAMNMACGE